MHRIDLIWGCDTISIGSGFGLLVINCQAMLVIAVALVLNSLIAIGAGTRNVTGQSLKSDFQLGSRRFGPIHLASARQPFA